MKKTYFIVAMLLIVMMVFGACKSEDTTGPATGSSAPAATAAGGGTAPAAPTAEVKKSAKDTLVQRLPGDPGNANVFNNGTDWTQPIIGSTLEPLMRLDTNREYQGYLAESWDIAPDGLSVTVHLRKGVKFHNGQEMTADDVLFSVERMLADGNNKAYYYMDYENVKATDDYTVVFPLVSVNASALDGVSRLTIYSKYAWDNRSGDAQFYIDELVGTGPYKLKEWVPAAYVLVERFDDYWGEKALIQNIQFRCIVEVAVAMMELETGGVDVMLNAAKTDVDKVLAGDIPNLVADEYVGDLMHYIGFNCDPSRATSNSKLRFALAHAVDREELFIGAYNESGKIAYTAFSNTYFGAVSYENNWPIQKDIEKAKALLAEAGYPNGVDLVIACDASEVRLMVAEQLISMFDKIGVRLTINQMESAALTDLLNNGVEYDLWIRAFAGAPGSEAAQGIVSNAGKIIKIDRMAEWEAINALLQKAGTTLDRTARAAIWAEFQQKFFEEWLPYYPLVQADLWVIRNKNLVDYNRITGPNYTYNLAYFTE